MVLNQVNRGNHETNRCACSHYLFTFHHTVAWHDPTPRGFFYQFKMYSPLRKTSLHLHWSPQWMFSRQENVKKINKIDLCVWRPSMLSPSLADTPHLSGSARAPAGCAAFLCSVEACQGRKLQVHERAASVDRTLSRGVWERARVRVFWCWDLLLVQSCIDAVCHCRLGPVSADPPLAPPPRLSRLERR